MKWRESFYSFYHDHKRPLFTFTLYSVLLVLIQLILVSLMTYFHFLLGHKMSIIENWLGRNFWEILIASKLIGAFIILKFIDLENYQVRPLVNFINSHLRLPHFRMVTLIAFLWPCLILMGHWQFPENRFRFFQFQLVSFCGEMVFYLTDFILFSYILHRHSITGKKGSGLWMIFFPLLATLQSFFLNPYFHIRQDYLQVLHWVVLGLSLDLERDETMGMGPENGLFYIMFLVAPLAAFWGLDPVWHHDYSYAYPAGPLSRTVIFVAWGVAICYFKNWHYKIPYLFPPRQNLKN